MVEDRNQDDWRYRIESVAMRASRIRRAEAQRRVDSILPAFLIDYALAGYRRQGDLRGSYWCTWADLTLGEQHDERAGVRYIWDLAPPIPSSKRGSVAVLPRGSCLRLLAPYFEGGYGGPGGPYLDSISYDLAVEGGPLAGTTVSLLDDVREMWSRATLAAAMIVPADGLDLGDPHARRQRYENAVEILGAAVAARTQPAELSIDSDLDAVGAFEDPPRG